MSRVARVRAEAGAAWRSFVRRRTAVFFTFFFPVILILIFGALVRTDPTGTGLFTEPPGYYVPGYLAVVVLFTPLSRVGSTVARHREGNRFEKLATTPLTRAEWLAAHTAVNVAIIGAASLLLLGIIVAVTDAAVTPSPWLVPLVALGVTLFCGIGAALGRVADSQDGVIAASNTIALPMLFLAETFVTDDLLPEFVLPLVDLLPLTYFSRGVRAVTYAGTSPVVDVAVLAALAVVAFAVGAAAIPRTD
ncbi:ABC transporter permease [Halostella salina]|uniref:ABC transporter permease n=1 Tax=Halostella salina TaxID=1547897 RepID=UPI000EF75CED|nr:ABC transporter permease [Halostella salina]